MQFLNLVPPNLLILETDDSYIQTHLQKLRIMVTHELHTQIGHEKGLTAQKREIWARKLANLVSSVENLERSHVLLVKQKQEQAHRTQLFGTSGGADQGLDNLKSWMNEHDSIQVSRCLEVIMAGFAFNCGNLVLVCANYELFVYM